MNDSEKDFEEKIENKIEEKLEKTLDCNYNKRVNHSNVSSNNCVYGLGVIGAAIFFIAKATSFWAGVLGILKALVWPAFLVYELLKFLIK